MSAPIESRLRVDGVELALYEWPGDGQTVVFVHATGFHARCWDAVIDLLPGHHCLAIDMRGHGRSSKPPPPEPYRWSNYATDMVGVLEQLDLRGAIGVGHSKGGYAVARAAGIRPESFAALLLVDPVIMPPERYGLQHGMGEHYAARRRNHWQSVEEMIERFASRPQFAAWDPRVLRDYCTYGLLPAEDGGYVLACPPEIEAATYAFAMSSDPYPDLAGVDVPVRVLRARERTRADHQGTMAASPTAADLASRFVRGEDIYLPDQTHLMAMEAPALIAEHVRSLST